MSARFALKYGALYLKFATWSDYFKFWRRKLFIFEKSGLNGFTNSQFSTNILSKFDLARFDHRPRMAVRYGMQRICVLCTSHLEPYRLCSSIFKAYRTNVPYLYHYQKGVPYQHTVLLSKNRGILYRTYESYHTAILAFNCLQLEVESRTQGLRPTPRTQKNPRPRTKNTGTSQ